MTEPDTPSSVASAAAHGGLLMLRDSLLNGGVLLALVVGIGGVMRGGPWVWIGPLLGVIGIVVSFAGHRGKVERTATGPVQRDVWPQPAVWAAAVAVPLMMLGAFWLMWG